MAFVQPSRAAPLERWLLDLGAKFLAHSGSRCLFSAYLSKIRIKWLAIDYAQGHGRDAGRVV